MSTPNNSTPDTPNTPDEATELDDAQLENVAGGVGTWNPTWKENDSAWTNDDTVA